MNKIFHNNFLPREGINLSPFPCPAPFPAALRYNPPMAHDHDTGYKLLFSHPEMVRDLLVG
ncbi:MAG: hypothetical protein WC091_08285, partial [Sulfuricellaceae bacterium]